MNPVLQLLIYIIGGVCIVRFARSAYSDPERVRQQWYPQWSTRKWSSNLLRCLAVIWIFLVFLAVQSGLIQAVPFLKQHRGDGRLTLIVAIAVALTAIVISVTPRRV
jgi:hypothetical protein